MTIMSVGEEQGKRPLYEKHRPHNDEPSGTSRKPTKDDGTTGPNKVCRPFGVNE